MRFLFIRHGEPDYVNDCLTATGRLQAAAAAKRLAGEGICEIYASPLGRAQETAGYTAARVEQLCLIFCHWPFHMLFLFSLILIPR